MNKIRVIVAEDEAIIRLDLVETLIENGFDVVGEAANGEKAIELAQELRPDVAILDIKMPGMSGLEAGAHIVEKELCAVIMLTAFGTRDLIDKASELGAMAYLRKPYQCAELIGAIEIANREFQLTTQLRREVRDLEKRLSDRKSIDIAKAKLVVQGHSEAQAFDHIRKLAMDKRTTMGAIAQQILGEQ